MLVMMTDEEEDDDEYEGRRALPEAAAQAVLAHSVSATPRVAVAEEQCTELGALAISTYLSTSQSMFVWYLCTHMHI